MGGLCSDLKGGQPAPLTSNQRGAGVNGAGGGGPGEAADHSYRSGGVPTLCTHIKGRRQLIVGIDYSITDSNGVYSKLLPARFTCENSINLHFIQETPNRFESTLDVLRDNYNLDDSSILFYGFGDALTRPKKVKKLGEFPDLEEVKRHYKKLTPELHITNKKSFAPIIEEAITVSKMKTLECLTLAILFDWPEMSEAEWKATMKAIKKARGLSIVALAIGEGEAETMKRFRRDVRGFSNFKLVAYKDNFSAEGNQAEFSSKVKKIFQD